MVCEVSKRERFGRVGAMGRSRALDYHQGSGGLGTTRVDMDTCATNVSSNANTLTVDLVDGRLLSVPLAWFPRLLHANARQRKNWKLIGDGEGIHWPDLDEDLSVEGLLRGTEAPGSRSPEI
jgi:hypothetical protein